MAKKSSCRLPDIVDFKRAPAGLVSARLYPANTLPHFFQVGSCSPRAQLRMPSSSFLGALGMDSMLSKISRKSCAHRTPQRCMLSRRFLSQLLPRVSKHQC